MNGSYSFLLHLIGFGILSSLIDAGLIVESKIRLEPDWNRKLYLSSLIPQKVLGPVAMLLLLLTGIGNIFNRYSGSPEPWYDEGWLRAKMVLFLVLIINGAVTGRILLTRRTQLVQSVSGKIVSPEADASLRSYNTKIMTFYVVQIVLLIAI